MRMRTYAWGRSSTSSDGRKLPRSAATVATTPLSRKMLVRGETALGETALDSTKPRTAPGLNAITSDSDVVGLAIVVPDSLPGDLRGHVCQLAHERLGFEHRCALAAAGGFSDFAHRDAIYVLRYQLPIGERVPLRIRFTYRSLVEGARPAATFRLRDGDVVVVE